MRHVFDTERWRSQCPVLLSRYARILMADPKHLFFLLLQAPVIAALVGLTYGNIVIDYAEQHASDWKQVAFLLLLSVLWCSSTNGVREIVKEKHVLRHESRYRLNRIAYLLSKFALLGGIAVVQAALMLLVLGSITGLKGHMAIGLITVSGVALAGTAMGLAISAAVRTSEQAVTVLPILVIGQAVYSGGLATMKGLNKLVAMVFASSFWGLEALKTLLPDSMLNATFPGAPGHYQYPIVGRPIVLGLDLMALGVHVAAWLAFALVCLALQNQRRSS